jgi:hypothetical protein
MQLSFSKFFSMQVYFSCCLIKGKEKKIVWRWFCEWLFEAVAHLPAAVSLPLLQALLIADGRSELNTHLVPQALFT